MRNDIMMSVTIGAIAVLVSVAVIVLLVLRRRKSESRREFLENNPCYGDDYYYNPVQINEDKVEYYDVTQTRIKKLKSNNRG